MGSNGEGGRLHRKLSLPARFGSKGSLRKSPKPAKKASKPLPPEPPEHPTGPPPLPPKPSTLPPKPPPLSSKPTKISPQPPELTPKPHNLTAYSPKITHKPTEFTPEHIPQPAEPTPKPSTRMFNNQEHAATILQGVEHFRSDEALCDVILESGDGSETFPVHRIIMASASEYFRDMFTSGMKDKDQGVVKLQGVNGQGLRNIINYIYTGRVTLGMDGLRDTLEAASYLQVQPLLQFCNQLLSSEVTIDNCIEVECVARELHLEEVQVRVREFVRENFSALVQSGRYLQLSVSCMSHSLGSHALKGFMEVELYHVARCWLDHDPTRHEHMLALMSCVRFPLMPPAELLRISQEDPALRSDPEYTQLLLEASTYQTLPFLQPTLQSARTRIRSDSTHLLVLGGVTRQQLAVSHELRLYDDKAGAWRALWPMEVPRYQHCAAVLGGFLFVVGGQDEYDTKGRRAVDSVYRYDPRNDHWLQLASLNEKRTYFHLSALRGQIYAVGGRNSNGEIGTVECYDFHKNEWTFMSPMAEPLYGHAGTVHGDLMYISGGITRDSFKKELFCYDPVTDTWSQRADMATPRGLHCMCTVRDRLYVMAGNALLGGGNHSEGNGEYVDILSVEFYSPASGQWTAAAPMPLGQTDVGVAVLRGQLYVVGGYSWSSRCMVDVVQRYDPEHDTWEQAFSVPEPIGGIRACTMMVHMPDDLQESHAHESPLDMPTN